MLFKNRVPVMIFAVSAVLLSTALCEFGAKTKLIGSQSHLCKASEKEEEKIVFQLIDKLLKLENPNKRNLENIFGRELFSKQLGFYDSEEKLDGAVHSFHASYGQKGEIVCANVKLNPSVNLKLTDLSRRFGKWTERSKDSYYHQREKAPVSIYTFKHRKRCLHFYFSAKSKNHALEGQVDF